MAGHSHAANIMYRKAAVDRKRAKIFSKLARMITVAAKQGGGDPDGNPKLRLAMEKARVVSMPKDNIERAIKKGTGESEAGAFEEVLYEGYGPGGVAVMLEALTDNRHRTAPEVRNLFAEYGGNLGATGAVAWMFERKAVFLVTAESGWTEDRLLETTLEIGAEDLIADDGAFEIRGEPARFVELKAALEARKVPLGAAEVAYVPKNKVQVTDVAVAKKVLELLDALEDNDDVQQVYANYEFPDDVAAKVPAP